MTLEQRENNFREEVCDSIKWCYPSLMLNEFFYYWTEPNRSGTKMKFELEKTWDTKRRLQRWFNNQNKWNGNNKPTAEDKWAARVEYANRGNPKGTGRG